MSVTHVAGPPVCIAGRVIQRCMVCGEKLCDSLNAAMPTEPDGSPPVFPTWATAQLVRHEGGNPSSWIAAGMFEDDDVPLPDDFCLALVE